MGSMIEIIGGIGAIALQIIGGVALCRWIWRESEEGGRIHRVIYNATIRFLTWWDGRHD